MKCRTNTGSKNPKVEKTRNEKMMLLLKCAVCDSKKSKLIKQQEASELLNSLGIKTLLNKIPLLGPLLFQEYKMNEIVNKFLLAGDELILEMHLRQPGFTYSSCRPFTENKKRMQKFKEAGDSRYIYQNKLDKVCFEHDMAYGDFKGSATSTDSDKILRNNAFNVAKNAKYVGYQRDIASVVYKCFDKKNFGSGIKIENTPDQQLAEKLHKPSRKEKYTQLL